MSIQVKMVQLASFSTYLIWLFSPFLRQKKNEGVLSCATAQIREKYDAVGHVTTQYGQVTCIKVMHVAIFHLAFAFQGSIIVPYCILHTAV